MSDTLNPTQSTYQKIKEAVTLIQERSAIRPQIGLILGSGLGPIADHVTERTVIPYSEIPHFHGTSVEGHAGQMILGNLASIPVVCLQGRFHLYEGYPMEDVAFPTRTVCGLGVHTLLLTNAAGGVNTRFQPGDIMLIEDHLNLMGDNPLKGPNISELGPRFPDMSEAYNGVCREILLTTAAENGIPLKRGVYAGLLGPTYETPAEVRMLRTLGADSVGMSTVPEAIAANHLGLRVCGLSLITNLAAGMVNHKLSHQEVMDTSKQSGQQVAKLIEAAVPKLARKS